MRVYYGLIILCILSIFIRPSWGKDEFLCQCQAKGPGFEETNRITGGIDKICTYQCSCIAWDAKKDPKTGGYLPSAPPLMNVPIGVSRLATTALSREKWDHGSHVCHGQYSYRPNLSDANWKIKVRFDVFTINTQGDVSYPEGAKREIAQGINEEGFKYTKSAPEIAKALKLKVKDL